MSDTVPVYVGNTVDDGRPHRGWVVGHFVEDEADPRSTTGVEIKWSVHPAGRIRQGWNDDGERTTTLVLVSGRFRLDLPDRTIVLSRQGDYVVWGPGGRHTWRAEEESVTITIRWPSVAPQGALPSPVGDVRAQAHTA